MNKIIFTIILGISILIFTACEKEHPGYLFSNETAYPVDSLVILTPASQRQAIAEMRATQENFDNTEEGKTLKQKKAELEEPLQTLEEQYTNLQKEMWAIDELMSAAQENKDQDEYDRLTEERGKIRKQWKNVGNKIWDIKDAIAEIDEQIEAAIGNIETEIALLQRRLENNVAYTTSIIDKIKGTAPLIYSIAGIKAENEGDADKFGNYLSVMGGGRFIIEWDENIPVGRYILSLYVENEGWKNLLPEVFTIIVK